MRREEQRSLLRRCLQLAGEGTTQLAENTAGRPVGRYTDAEWFAQEQARIFRRLPVLVGPVSMLPDCGSFLTCETLLGSLLLTRDASGRARGFHNVCRHRGTRLVDAPAGSADRFTCPYHAWTYAQDGRLIGVPHAEQSFPGLDRNCNGLVAVDVNEQHGLIWVLPEGQDLGPFLAGLEADLDWLALADLEVFAEDRRVWHANWKLVAEGGLESYHFRKTHQKTIAPYFFDNLSLYQAYGAHFRTVLPRRSLLDLQDVPEQDWVLRAHAHLTYALFPASTLLVQADHVAWIQSWPQAADRTEISIRTLVPRAGTAGGDRPASYWRTNHDITCATLHEDFAMAESIQAGLASGANAVLQFGRSEGALELLNRIIDEAMAQGPGQEETTRAGL